MEAGFGKFVRYQHQMTIVFVACFLCGAAATFVHPWLPVIFVVVYFAIGLFATRNQKNSDRFADSLYYLGFLLTLVALLHATQEANATEAIIENLGTGLSTTLAGLAFRVLVIQFRETVSDQEEEAQVGLETEVQNLIATFSQLTEGIRNFHKEFLGEANLLKDAVTHATQSVDDSAKTFAALPGVLEAALEPAARNLAGKISAVDIPVDVFRLKADQAFVPLDRAFNTVATQFTAAGHTIVTELQRSASSVTQEIDGITKQIAAAHNNLNLWIAEVAAIPTTVRKTISESVIELRTKIRTINFDAFISKQTTLVSQLEATTNAFQLAESNTVNLNAAVSALGRSAEQIQAAFAESVTNSEAIAKIVVEIADVSPLTTRFTNEIAQLTSASANIRTNAEATVQHFRKMTQELASFDFAAVKTKQQEMSAGITTTTNDLGNASVALSALSDAVGSLNDKLGAIEQAIAKAARSSEEMANVVLQLGNTGAVMQRLTNEIGDLTTLDSDLRNTTRLAKKSMIAAAQDLNGLREDIAGVRHSTEALLEFAATELKQ